MVLLRGNNQLRNKFMFGTERKAREICVSLILCNLIGQKYDTWSDWQDSECKPRENLRLLNNVRLNWSKEWHFV